MKYCCFFLACEEHAAASAARPRSREFLRTGASELGAKFAIEFLGFGSIAPACEEHAAASAARPRSREFLRTGASEIGLL